ncbi:GNAT family N-acetyltransferase [Hyphococcus flavus]|uniref:GNAT family N-acetyltransferase n=1 Tax=Hyphococcus flavus TaxID=1866326 RepID=A0AAE9ZFP6_9PROT|nr:GNAT family N-acetyltransferase [Hyphococcus flavus]WDI32990.1 GNAT family N-acetyltransferase [Hyphococcus flavus]
MTIEIETERLVLRPMAAEDVENHIVMMQDPAVAASLTPDQKPRSRAEEWRAAASILGHWQIRGYGWFSVFEKKTGNWAGRVGPWYPEGWPGLECGWAVKSEHWGKGYAPEAAIATIRWTFDQFPDLPRIVSVIDPENSNSQAVAEKVGETKSGEIFEYWSFKLDVWAADRAAWLDRFGG